MKKINGLKKIAMGVILGATLTASSTAFAGSSLQVTSNNGLKYVVNNKEMPSSPAVMANNSTYLKLRDVANMLGYDVTYDSKAKTITMNKKDSATVTNASSVTGKSGTKMNATLNSELKYIVDGKTASSSTPAVMVDNSTYLNLRDVSKMLAYDVAYDGATKTIALTEGLPATTPTETAQDTTVKEPVKPVDKANDLSTNKYPHQKLPLSLTREDNVTLTIREVFQTDKNTIIKMHMSNPSGGRVRLEGQSSVMNGGLPTKKMFGANFEFKFYNGEKEAEFEVAYKLTTFTKDTKNFELAIKNNNPELKNGVDQWFIFKIDSEGMFK